MEMSAIDAECRKHDWKLGTFLTKVTPVSEHILEKGGVECVKSMDSETVIEYPSTI